MNLKTFTRRMEVRANNVPGELNRIVKKVALAIDQTLVLATPVDTGAARSNWRVSVGGRPKRTVIAPYAPIPQGHNPEKFGERDNADGAITHAQGLISQRQPGQTIYIVNRTPYISDLNEGSSSQAPAMFFERAVQAATSAIKGVTFNTARKGL